MFKKGSIVIILSLFVFYSYCQSHSQSNYHPPLSIPLILSANFGELRANHFHMGVDFKTNQKEGLTIHAIEIGYLSRVKVSPHGYGKVLYVNHPNGITSVYAHCSKFSEKIDAIVDKIQYDEQENEVEIFFAPNDIPLEKGEIIAFSGNTGHSQGPHLHFELRNTADQKALNPLIFGFNISDHQVPELKALKVYGINKDGYTMSNKTKTIHLPKVVGQNINLKDTISIESNFYCRNGGLGFAFESYDQLDGASNLCGIYGSRLEINNELFFCQAIDSIAFEDSRQINTHKDYLAFTIEKRHFQKSYKNKFNSLEIYPCDKDGILYVVPDSIYSVNYQAFDTKNNTSSINFTLRTLPGGNETCHYFEPANNYFFPDSTYTFESANAYFHVERNTFYEPFKKTFSLNPPYSFGDPKQPIHKKIDVKLKVPANYNPKSCYLQVVTGNGNKKVLTSRVDLGWLVASSEFLGTFSIHQDNIAPSIYTSNFTGKEDYIDKKVLIWQIKESQTAIAKYNLFVDGKWQIIYYESKGDYLLYELPENLNGSHEFRLIVADQCGNQSSWNNQLILK